MFDKRLMNHDLFTTPILGELIRHAHGAHSAIKCDILALNPMALRADQKRDDIRQSLALCRGGLRG